MGEIKHKHDLYQATPPEIKINGKEFYKPYDLTISESIYSPVRKGFVLFKDIFGIPEFTSFHNTAKEEKFTVEIKNAFEQDKKRNIRFGLYNMLSQIDTAYEGKTRTLSYMLLEEPIFSNLYKKVIRKSFKNKTAKDILEDIIKNELEIDQIESKSGKKDPKVPLFISPFWKFLEIYNYLRYFVDEGPFVFFPYSKDDETKYKLLPLQKIVKDGAYDGEPKGDVAVPMSSEIQKLLPMKQDYILSSVTPDDKTGLLQGHTFFKYDYFNEKGKDGKKLKDFAEKDKSKYKWEEGTDDYKLDKRNPLNIICGNYENGSKDSDGLGEYSFYLNNDFSDNKSNMNTSILPKKLLETYMKNKFYESFYKKISIKGKVTGHEKLKPGMIVTMNVPSTNQKDDNSVNHDESLQGDWLITDIEHKFSLDNGQVLKYEAECTFIRTGLEKYEKSKKQKLKGGS